MEEGWKKYHEKFKRHQIILSYKKIKAKSILITANEKFHARERINAVGLFNLEKECISNTSGWELNPRHFSL